MTRNLAKRVEQLETRIMPDDPEPRKMVIQFVESNGEITGTMDVVLGPPARGKEFWRRGGRR